jgi:hypothetical protein
MNEVWGPWGQAERDIIEGADPGATWNAMIEEVERAIAGY